MPRSRHRKKPARSRASRSLAYSRFNSPVEDQKMSEVILEFIEPYKKLARDDSQLEKLIALGVVAWNLSLLPGDEREETLNDLMTDLFRSRNPIKKLASKIRKWIGAEQKIAPELSSVEAMEFKQIIHEMVEHKLRRFARNRRPIISYHVDTEGDDAQLFVASSFKG